MDLSSLQRNVHDEVRTGVFGPQSSVGIQQQTGREYEHSDNQRHTNTGTPLKPRQTHATPTIPRGSGPVWLVAG